MITYVNTVFVSNKANFTVTNNPTAQQLAALTKGDFVKEDLAADEPAKNKFRIGIVTGKTAFDQMGVATPIVRWSNWIKYQDIRSISINPYDNGDNSEDMVGIDFTNIDTNILDKFAEGGKRIIVRLTFKDLPTRFRNWTESYEYVTEIGDTANSIAAGIAQMITVQWKRARVTAVANGAIVRLTAMPYDDDNSVDSLSWAAKVRFNANVYYTDPAADGWESLNKHSIKGIKIGKMVGKWHPGSGKLVRDREAQAMGYLGVLNRGEGVWPVIKPAMETDIDSNYDVVTLEFENEYRAADDIFRKTKQAVEFYVPAGTSTPIARIFGSMLNGDIRDTQLEINHNPESVGTGD